MGVTRKWAGVDSVWEQDKLEARKMLAADWASERQANIAQPKRVSAGAPRRPALAPHTKCDGVQALLLEYNRRGVAGVSLR